MISFLNRFLIIGSLLFIINSSTYADRSVIVNSIDSLSVDLSEISPVKADSLAIPDSVVLYNWRLLFVTDYSLPHPLELQFIPKFKGVVIRDIKYISKSFDLFLFTEKNCKNDSIFDLFSSKTLLEIHQNYIISNPDKITVIWNDIPEPHKLLERGFLKRVDAQEELKKNRKNVGEKEARALVIKKEVISPWSFSGVEYLQLQQTGQINWANGGENKLVFLNDLRLKLNYKHHKVEWENYGISKMGISFNDDKSVDINSDQLELNTKFGYKAAPKWFYSANANLKTQLFYDTTNNGDGTITYNSGFLSPGYFTAGIGMDYKPNTNLSVLLSPITSKLTFVIDTVNIDPQNYNIKPGNFVIRQVGFNIIGNFKIPFSNLTSLATRVELFKDYIEKYNSWYFYMENILDMRINKYLVLRVDFQWKYSEIESDKLQFIENVLLGFTYNF